MKKLTHIAAPVALTALLSACAAPGTGPVTLENLGPGELATIQEAVVEAMVNKGPDGGPSPVEQAMQNTLNKPGDNNTPSMLQQAIQLAVQQVIQQALKESDFTRRETFEFDLSNVEPEPEGRIREELKRIFVEAKNQARKARPGLTVNIGKLGYGPYYVENLAGLTSDDEGFIRVEIEDRIAKIPGLSANEGEGAKKTYAPIRRDPKAPVPDIPKKNTSKYTAVTGGGEAKLTCPLTARFTHRLYGDKEAEKRNIQLFIHDGNEMESEIGPTFFYDRRIIPVLNKVGKVVDCDIGPPDRKYHHVMAKLEDPTVVQYHRINVVNNEPDDIPDEYTEGRPACPPLGWEKTVRDDFVAELSDAVGCYRE